MIQSLSQNSSCTLPFYLSSSTSSCFMCTLYFFTSPPLPLLVSCALSTFLPLLRSVLMEFHGEFHDIKYHQFCWHGKKRGGWSFMACEKNFITIKSNWHSYLIFSPAKCVYKTPTETGLLMPNSQNYTCFGTEE